MACVVRWDVEDVGMWLEQCLQLPYRLAFREARVNGSRLIELNEEQLAALGVTESSHLLRLLSHVAVFRSQLGRSLLVAEEPERGPELATLADVSFASDPAQWSPILRDREIEQRQRGSPQDHRRQKLTGRARSAPGIQTYTPSRLDESRNEKQVRNRQQQPGQKGSGKATRTVYRRARSAETCGRHSIVGPSSSQQQVSKVARGQQSVSAGPEQHLSRPSSGSTNKQQAPTARCMQDPSAVVAPFGFSSDEAGSSLAAESTTLGSETCGVVFPFGGRSHADVDVGGDGGFDEITLSARARQPSSSSFSAPRSPRVRGVCQDSIASNASVVYSEFGRDQRRGVAFSTAERRLIDPLVKQAQGPEIYDTAVSALNKSGVSKIGQAERRTLECMFIRGKASPGVGKYSPPCRTHIRGGSMGSAVRFRNGPAEKSPGPESYTPQHFYLSNFK